MSSQIRTVRSVYEPACWLSIRTREGWLLARTQLARSVRWLPAYESVRARGGRPRAVANGGRAEVPSAPPRRCSGQKRVPGACLALGGQREQIRSNRAACSQRSITAETDDPNATHGSPQGWSEAVVAQEASCKARYGHRRSLRVHLDTLHSLSSPWDPIVPNKGFFTQDKELAVSASQVLLSVTVWAPQVSLHHYLLS